LASYDIQPGNGQDLFWFRRFINLSLAYLLSHLPTYLQPWDPHGDNKQTCLCTWLPADELRITCM